MIKKKKNGVVHLSIEEYGRALCNKDLIFGDVKETEEQIDCDICVELVKYCHTVKKSDIKNKQP